jgi:transmembrane sensor
MEDRNFTNELKKLEEGRSVIFDKDSGLEVLNAFKKDIKDQPVPSRSMWRAIKKEIGVSSSQEETSATVVRLYVRRGLLAAAVVLIALVGYMNVKNPSIPKSSVIASTKQAYEAVEIENQASVFMRNNSRLNLVKETDKLYRVYLEGEMQTSVEKRSEQVFEVETGTALIRVLGTQFTLKASKNETVVYLKEGRIELRKKTGNVTPVFVKPGEIVSVTHDEMKFLPEDQAEVYTAWLRHEIVLQSRTVSSVAEELQRHYNIILSIPTSVQQEKLSGVLPLTSLEEVFSAIELVIGGNFTQTSERVYHWRQREF